mgnify:CR=1 FL=1
MAHKLNKQNNMKNNKYKVSAKRHTNYVNGEKVDDYVEVIISELSEKFKMSQTEPVQYNEYHVASLTVGVERLSELADEISKALKSIKI